MAEPGGDRINGAERAVQDAAPADPEPGRGQSEYGKLGPVIAGFIVGGLLILVLGFWVGRVGTEETSGPAVPPITLESPRDGEVVSGAIGIDFATDAVLRYGRDGWGAGRLHIHVMVNGSELMPGRRDIEQSGAGRYRWTLPVLPPGSYELYLFWADARHRPLSDGASEVTRVEVAP